MDRRDFLGRALTLAAGGSGGIGVPLVDLVGESTPHVPARVRADDVAEVEDATAQIASWDLQRGGHLAADQGAALLRWSLELRSRAINGDLVGRLDRTIAYLADRTAWATYDSGRHDQARRQFQLGLAVAADARDVNVRAQLFCDMANQAVYLRQPNEALRMADAAAAPGLVPQLRSAVHGVMAEAYAAMGRQKGAQVELTRAEDAFAGPTTGTAPVWLNTFRTEAGMHHAIGYAGYLLARATGGTGTTAALEHLGHAVAGLGDDRSRAAMFATLRMATLHLGQGEGDPGTGARLARTVLPRLTGVRSTRMISEVQALRFALARHESRSEMADLGRDLDQAIAQFAW
ncbi:twin-arginine translocation signal domain-containing protein [Longispora sp. NPDC051575]|uniref:twin-arginine translocation signal domain-containing protein n=1 Tax=Longispora sp. NPDC051575 TaxID=3154943 RepID=UPI0034420D58